MPTFVVRSSVPAGGVVLPITGSLYEYIQFNAKVDIAMVQQTGTVGGIVAVVNSGPDTLMEEAPISAAGRFPIMPDDYFLSDIAAQGDRLKIQLRNTTGASLDVVTVLQLAPV